MIHFIIALVWGIVVGFGIAIPIGPVGVIVIQRTIAKSRAIGLVTGLGSALTDGFLAAIGVFGIKVISEFIIREEISLHMVGGIMFLMIGLWGVFSKTKPVTVRKDSAITFIEHFISGIILTATNPLTAGAFFLAFATIGPKLGISGPGIASFLVAGVFVGSCLWWLFLTHMAKILGARIKPEHFEVVNKVFGLIVAILGAITMLGVLFQ